MVTTMMTNDAKASMANLLRVVLGAVGDGHRAGVVEHLLARREEHVRLDVLELAGDSASPRLDHWRITQ